MTKVKYKEHNLNSKYCWCEPIIEEHENGDVIIHKDIDEYLYLKLELIGDICVDYDGYRNSDDLMKLIDEIKNIAYKACRETWEYIEGI